MQMTKEFPMTNNKANAGVMAVVSSFKLRHSFVIRHSSFAIRILTLAIRAYQLTVAPTQTFLFGPTAGCRFTPSCSQYAMEAVRTRGAIAGSWLATKRICRCHPWGDGGQDPVPECGKTLEHAH